MLRTEKFAALLGEFQDGRHALTQKYEKDLKALERHKGSGVYESDRKALTERYNADLEALKWKYTDSLNDLVDQMDRALHSRSYKAPSAEQVQLLQLVDMQDDLTTDFLQRTAEAVKDCPAALYTLRGLAEKKAQKTNSLSKISEIRSCMAGYMAGMKDLPLEQGESMIKDLKNGLGDFLKYDSSRVSRIAGAYYQTRGLDVPMKRRSLFDGPEGCFREVGGMDAETYDRFSSAVDF